MSFSVALDWLSFTLKGMGDETPILQTLTPDGEVHSITPIRGYRIGRASNYGVGFHTNPDYPEMGTHVVIPGSALRMLEHAGYSTRQILRIAIQAHAKVTRIDLAKDAQNEGISLDAIYMACKAGQRTGTAQSIDKREEIHGGFSIYVGSWQSEAFVNMYDKAVERGVEGDWKRMELRLKGDIAKAFARVLAEPNCDWNAMLCGRVKKMMDTEVDGYQRWLFGAATEGLPQVEKKTDREAWILNQVIKAVCEHLREHPNSEAIKLLVQQIEFAKSGRWEYVFPQQD